MTFAAAILLPLLLGAALRVVPIVLSPRGLGIDHWYWKSYIESYSRDRQFPPSLPQYVLEEHQWYPPLFPLLLSLLSSRIFGVADGLIALGIDLLRLLLLEGFAAWVTHDPGVVLVAGLLYATSPIQISYNVQLNPRGLGALMLDALLLLLLARLDLHGPAWLWGPVILLGGLILLTHKMTSQLFWFVMLLTAAIYRDVRVLALIPLSVVAALVLSRGFYINVLRAHWDIVTFWNRNWPWVGADLVRESPVYGDPGYERPEKLHRKGVRGIVRQCATLVGFNPASWIGCLLLVERLWLRSPRVFFPSYLLVWLVLPCLFALMTTFVRPLKCLGAGYLYLYNTSLLASLLLGIAFRQTLIPHVSQPLILGAVAGNIAATAIYYRHFLGNKRQRVDERLDQLIARLRDMPRGLVMAIPANWYEVIAYKTGFPVLWGAHGYGFRKIEPTWPRLLLPVDEIVRRYGVRYLVTMDGTLTPQFEADLPPATRVSQGEYSLYCFASPTREAVPEIRDVAGL